MRLWCGQYRPVDRATVVDCSGPAYRSSSNFLRYQPATEDREHVNFLCGCQGIPFGIPCHFSRQPRQQVAVACWATKIGWFLIGVCLPSFGGLAGARRSSMNFSPCDITASNPLRSRYSLSAAGSRNRRRKEERASLSNTSSRSLFIFLAHYIR